MFCVINFFSNPLFLWYRSGYATAANDIRISKKVKTPKNPSQKPKYFRQNKYLAGSKLVLVSGAPMKIRNQGVDLTWQT
jgi:hypothetical protein